MDYGELTSGLTFVPGFDRVCVTVSIADDGVLEGTENFFGTLTTTDSSVVLTPDEAQVNIIEGGENILLSSCVLCMFII